MGNFNNFYSETDFCNNLVEQFNINESQESNVLNSYLKGKKTLRLSKGFLDVLTDSPEKLNTATIFEPVSESIIPPQEKSPGVTLFAYNKIVRNPGEKNFFDVNGSKAQAKGIAAIEEGDYRLNRKKVLARLKDMESVVLKNTDTETIFELIAPAGFIERNVFKDSGIFTPEEKFVIDREKNQSIERNESIFIKKLMEQTIPADSWTDARQEAIQAIGLTGDFESLFQKLLDILYDVDDDFEDDDVFEIYKSEKFRKIISPILTAFETDDGAEELDYFKKESNNTKFQIMDWIQIIRLMIGASLFSKNTGLKNRHIIHKSISQFRKLSSDESEGKTSTVDTVLSNVDNLIELLKTNSTKINEDGSVSVISNDKEIAKFYQVSFKKDSKAQIGAVTSFIAANYKIQNRKDAAKEVMESLNEGFLSRIKTKIKAISASLISKIVEMVSRSLNWFKSIPNKLSSESNKNKKKYAIELFSDILTEAEISYEELVSNYEAMSNDEKEKVINKAINKINKVLKSVEAKLNAMDNCGAFIDYIESVSVVSSNTFNSIVGNYTLAKTLDDMVSTFTEPGKVISAMSEILSEAIFGKSAYPIFIVYAADGEGNVKEPVELKMKKEFAKDKAESFSKNLNEKVPLFVFTARENLASLNKKNVGSYIYSMYTLSEVVKVEDDIDFKMMEYRMDSGNQITIKAMGEITMDELYAAISKIRT